MAVLFLLEAVHTFMRPEARTTARPARFVVATGPSNNRIAPAPVIAISPDGGRVVYALSENPNSPLYVRPIDQVNATAIPGTEGALMPFFSPDGAQVGFFAQGKLKKVQLGASAPTTVCDAPEPRGGTWGPDGTIVFAATPFEGLSRVSSEGGKREIMTTLDTAQNELSHRWPSFLPDGSGIVFTIWFADYRAARDDGAIALYSLRTGTHRVVLQGGTSPRVLAAGYLVFAHRHALLAVPFDLKRGAVSGRPVTVENDVITVTGWGSAQFAVSQDGTLAYMPIVPEPTRQLVWVDRTGHEEPLPVQPRVFSRPRESPDGSRVLVIVHDSSPAAIWGTTRRATYSRRLRPSRRISSSAQSGRRLRRGPPTDDRLRIRRKKPMAGRCGASRWMGVRPNRCFSPIPSSSPRRRGLRTGTSRSTRGPSGHESTSACCR